MMFWGVPTVTAVARDNEKLDVREMVGITVSLILLSLETSHANKKSLILSDMMSLGLPDKL